MKNAILEAKLDKQEVKRVYTRLAPVYDLWATLTESRARERSLELADVRDGDSVLEVAVGTGIVFAELLRKNRSGRSVGIDLTEGMLAKARQKATRIGGNWELRAGDAYALPFADGEFDLVMNNYMFDLLPTADFSPVLAEMRRVLKPGGRLVLVNMTKGGSPLERIAESIYRVRAQWMGGCRGVLLLPYVKDAGFRDLRRETVTQLGFPSEIIVGIR